MRSNILKSSLLGGCIFFLILNTHGWAQTSEVSDIDIQRKDLGSALTELARQSHREIVFSSDLTRGLAAPEIHGQFTVEQALTRLLAGAGLTFTTASTGAIVIRRASTADDPQAANESVAAPTAFSDARGDSAGIMLDQIVVTGSPNAVKKLETPYAISTMNQENIQESAPRSTVDLLKAIPGINVENSGGEGGGENVVIRGLPFAGFRLLDVQEDGLPLFESNFERELQIDELYRVDLNTTQVELVRGGTAPIFSNNGSGGVLNLITNHGTESSEGEIDLTGGSHDLSQIDLAASGPINEHLLFAAGGFFRRDDGARDPGFSGADNGGQFKLALTYKLDDGGKIWGDFKYLNDRSIFYSDIPLVSPTTGASLAGLINPNSGTLDSASFQHVNILALNGQAGLVSQTENLADGIHPDVKTLTIGGDFNLADGWKLSDKARYTNGAVLFNSILNGSPSAASSILSGYLGAATTAFPTTTALRFVYAGTNTAFDPSTTAGLAMTNTWQTTTTDFSEVINDARLDRTFDAGTFGRHDLTLGLEADYFTFKQAQLNAVIVTDVKSQPDLLDIQAVNAAGAVVGLVTNNGFSSYGSGDLIGNASGTSVAPYILDTWHITPALEVDAGVRHQFQQVSGDRGIIGTVTVATSGPLASRSITGLIAEQPYSKFLDGTSWTVGSSYLIGATTNVFGRYSSSYSLPRLSDQWGNLNNGVYGTLPNGEPIPTTDIKQAEGGVKVALPSFQFTGIGFWSHFQNLNSSTYVTNAAGQLVNQPLLINTMTYGIELEGAWKPLDWFELVNSATVQDPTIDRASTFVSAISANSIVGNQIPRAPPYTFSIQPTLIYDVGRVHARTFITYFGEASRYQDLTNTSKLPAYQTLDFGTLLQGPQGWGVNVHVYNLTNSAGLTEGNARAPLSNVLSVADATTGRPIFGRSFIISVQKRW